MTDLNSEKPIALRMVLWVGLISLMLAGLGYAFWFMPTASAPAALPTPAAILLPPPPTPALNPRPLPVAALVTPPPDSLPVLVTPVPGGVVLNLTPAPQAVGWATSLDGRSHFEVPNLHTGFFKGHIYQSAIQFDLSEVPPGSTLLSAVLQLVGLDEQNLSPGGTWQLNLLDPAMAAQWPELTYEALHTARVAATISPALASADLGVSQVNLFTFTPAQLALLQRQFAAGPVSFRLDGPTAGPDNLFTWDSGYHGQAESDSMPVLELVVIPPAAPGYVVVTSTPTPKNIITAAALAIEATRMAQTTGTFTPVPDNWVTPAIVTPWPNPANAATAAFQAALATAEAILYPTPAVVWTATATPIVAGNTPLSNQAVAAAPQATQATATPNYVIVTSTPPPENIITEAAIAIKVTQIAQITGTLTPVPQNWVTPLVVTPQPTPANAATAAYESALATAEAILYPTPVAVWTATPTPIFILLPNEIATPWATFTPTAAPPSIPAVLVGKIAFLSNRSGGPEPLKEPLAYVMDPDGSNLAVLTNRAVYDAAVARDSYSADQRFRAFVKYADIWTSKKKPAIFYYDDFYGVEEQVTQFGAGIAYDPVWSPTQEQIALVSNDSSNDEIWVINRDGSGALQLTRDPYAWWDKHPSWSPDGRQIVFWSNRSGQRQIWVMEADGSNPRSLSRTGYDDWDPVWIKYTDPAPGAGK